MEISVSRKNEDDDERKIKSQLRAKSQCRSSAERFKTQKTLRKGKGNDARIVIEIGFRGWGLGIRSKP
jgi:hypothetical protein